MKKNKDCQIGFLKSNQLHATYKRHTLKMQNNENGPDKKWIFHVNPAWMKAGTALLVSENIDIRSGSITRDKKDIS
jgi:hypothetical protein